jgi:hypothetical protein
MPPYGFLQLYRWPLLLVTLVLHVVSIGSVPAFVVLLRKNRAKLLVPFGVFLVVAAVFAAFWTVYALGGGFGPTTLLMCLSPVMALVSFLALLILAPSSLRAFGQDRVRRRVYLVGGLLVAALQLGPILGVYATRAVCDPLTRRNGTRIIEAVESYRKEYGTYPQDLDALVPAYLPERPTPACSWLSAYEGPGFTFKSTPKGVILTVESVDHGVTHIYDFATGEWSARSVVD